MEIKAFNKWSTKGITVTDPGLKDYINLDPKFCPRTGATYAGNKFHKSKVFIIERLMNKIMVPGHRGKKHFRTSYHCTGKAYHAYKMMFNVLTKIEFKTKTNPIEVFVRALENSAQREEIITIEYGGARYPKAVECSPQRRIDLAMRYMIQGSYAKSFNTKKSFEDALSDEIIAASQLSHASHAISKKIEIERQADGAR